MIEEVLIRTRKSVLEVCTEMGYNYPYEMPIELCQCNNCGIWLKYMVKDLDELDICQQCLEAYGP